MSLEYLKNIENPEIIEKINSKDPYTICDVLEETRGGIYLKKLEDAIIKTGDIIQIYEFLFLAVDMNITGFDRKRFEGIISKSGNPKLMCYAMEFVPGTNIEEMIKALINTGNTKYLKMLLNNEEYADVIEIVKKIYPNYEEIVEESKKTQFYPSSLEEFREYKDNIEELKRQIRGTKNPHLITELANYIEYLNEYKNGEYSIDDLTKLQAEIGDPMQSYEYLASVNVKDKRGLIKAVIDSRRVKFMYYVHEYVSDLTEEEKELLKKHISLQDPKSKYVKEIKSEREVSE